MHKKAWILLIVLLCIAFLMSCRRTEDTDRSSAQLVELEKALTDE